MIQNNELGKWFIFQPQHLKSQWRRIHVLHTNNQPKSVGHCTTCWRCDKPSPWPQIICDPGLANIHHIDRNLYDMQTQYTRFSRWLTVVFTVSTPLKFLFYPFLRAEANYRNRCPSLFIAGVSCWGGCYKASPQGRMTQGPRLKKFQYFFLYLCVMQAEHTRFRQ